MPAELGVTAAVSGEERRHRSSVYAFASRANTSPNPPFLCSDMKFAYHSFGIDPVRVGPFLPPGIVLTSEHIGFSALCVIGDAWSVGAFTWAFGGVIVDDHPSPDGSEGGLVLFSYVSPAAAPVFTETYHGATIAGATVLADDDDISWASVGPAGAAPHLRIGTKIGSERIVVDGIDRYLSNDADAHLIDWTVSYVADCRFGEVVAFEISDDAPAGIKAMRPTTVHWGMKNTDARCSFSAPRLARGFDEVASAAAERAFLSLLGFHPSAAVVLDADLRVRHMNAAARALVGGTVSRTQGYLRSADVVAQGRLETTVVAAISGTGNHAPFTLALRNLEPLIAEAFPLDPQVFGPGKVLLFLNDPRAPATRDAVPSLKLLGLTEAEARIAALVGAGSSPKDVANELGLAIDTIRSALKRVFDKLDVRRQAELATLVSRLSGG